MQFKYRPPVLSYKDRPPPTRRDLYVEQCRMQSANPVFQLVQKLQCPPGRNVDRGEPSPIRNVDETATKDDSLLVVKSTPKGGQIRGVAGSAVGQPEIAKFLVGKRARGKRHGQLGLRPAGKLREFERFGIRGEQHAVGAHESSADVENQRRAGLDAVDGAMLEYKDAELYRSPRQSPHQFARVQRSAGHFLAYSQFAGVGPMNERAGILGGAIEFMNARKVQVARDIQIAKDRRNSSQDITEPGQLSCGGFRQGESAGMTAGAGADRLGLEQGYTFGRIKMLQIRGGGEAAKAAANHSEVDLTRKQPLFRHEVDRPGCFSPTDWPGIHGQRWTHSFGWFPRDAYSQSQGTTKDFLRVKSARSSNSARFSRFDAQPETLGPLNRDFSLYSARSIREVIRPLRSSLPDLFTSQTRRLEWINDTCVFT